MKLNRQKEERQKREEEGSQKGREKMTWQVKRRDIERCVIINTMEVKKKRTKTKGPVDRATKSKG